MTLRVPISAGMVKELSAEFWSDPLQLRMIDGELYARKPENPWLISVRGYCPKCGGGLTVIDGSVACRDQDCMDRYAASRLLRGR